MTNKKFGFVIPPSEEKGVIKLSDGHGNKIDLKVTDTPIHADGYFFIKGISQHGEEMSFRFKSDHLEQIIG
jgi:hypothetical protein